MHLKSSHLIEQRCPCPTDRRQSILPHSFRIKIRLNP
uniref:Uncharacterized protein n=1 Tax=Rhizophora mucronata TaxID=61149 RepID=A0A2P2Q6N3_RHIMU